MASNSRSEHPVKRSDAAHAAGSSDGRRQWREPVIERIPLRDITAVGLGPGGDLEALAVVS